MNYADVKPLIAPIEKDCFGIPRPKITPEAVLLAACLSGDTYEMNVEPWVTAGWQDVGLMVDGQVTSLDGNENSPKIVSAIGNRIKLLKVKSRLSKISPVGQISGAVGEVTDSAAVKAVVMLHKAESNPYGVKYVAAVSFMGTGKRPYDWISNLKLKSEDNFHKGFLQLSRQFEKNEDNIVFPQAAKELGLEKLSLLDIVREAAGDNSRFRIFLTGHSQGGGIMQVYCFHKMAEDGVRMENIWGCGFASPTVATARLTNSPEIYPLYHVINGDDVIPRVGCQLHLGQMLLYCSDNNMREKCYSYTLPQESIAARKAVIPVVNSIRDMSDMLAFITAMIRLIALMPEGTIAKHINLLPHDTIKTALERVADATSSQADKLLENGENKVKEAYFSIFDKEMDEGRIQFMADTIKIAVDKTGVISFIEAMKEVCNDAHRIRWHQGKTKDKQCSYMYIAEAFYNSPTSLVPGIWHTSGKSSSIMWAYSRKIEGSVIPQRRESKERFTAFTAPNRHNGGRVTPITNLSRRHR